MLLRRLDRYDTLQDIDNALGLMSIRDGWKKREQLEDDLYVQ